MVKNGGGVGLCVKHVPERMSKAHALGDQSGGL